MHCMDVHKTKATRPRPRRYIFKTETRPRRSKKRLEAPRDRDQDYIPDGDGDDACIMQLHLSFQQSSVHSVLDRSYRSSTNSYSRYLAVLQQNDSHVIMPLCRSSARYFCLAGRLHVRLMLADALTTVACTLLATLIKRLI